MNKNIIQDGNPNTNPVYIQTGNPYSDRGQEIMFMTSDNNQKIFFIDVSRGISAMANHDPTPHVSAYIQLVRAYVKSNSYSQDWQAAYMNEEHQKRKVMWDRYKEMLEEGLI